MLEFYAFLKNQGFVWGPEPESYNDPIPGHYTYGPLGKLFKNKIEDKFRRAFNSLDYSEIETPVVYPQAVWEASGHWNKFRDPIIKTKSGAIYRLDKLIEEQFGMYTPAYADLSEEQVLEYAQRLIPPNGDTFDISSIGTRNLMMTVQSGSRSCALRPETATASYLAFSNMFRLAGQTLPFGFYQIGKVFRNEISPKQSILRCREFTQAEAHIVLDPKDKNNCHEYHEIEDKQLPLLCDNTICMMSVGQCLTDGYFGSQYYAWNVWIAFDFISKMLPIESIRIRRQSETERAFYALDAVDIEVNIDHVGWTEIAGVHDRGCYDLTQHGINNMLHCLEITVGIDRLIFALLDIYYDKKDMIDGKSIWRVPYQLAPVQISVFPLLKNREELVKHARKVYQMLRCQFAAEYDEKQSIGKRYLKSGIKGVPYCVTIDHQTLLDDTVTVRDRDSEDQIRLGVATLTCWFNEKIKL